MLRAAAVCFDHGATSGWHPAEVGRAMVRALEEASGNPGRAGHSLSLAAARVVEEARWELAGLLGLTDASSLILTRNATEGINLVLLGLLNEGDRVLVSSWEHNAVLRPLRALEAERKVTVELIPPAGDAPVDLAWLERSLEEKPARLVSLCQVSNVTGAILPVTEAGALCRRRGAFFLVDAAQGIGICPVLPEREGIDALAFSGHKGLLGPTGTGAVWLRRPEEIRPLIRGGTGSRSESEEQPEFPPDRFESGTANVPGLAGLTEGIRFVRRTGIEAIRERHRKLAASLEDRLGGIDRLKLHGRAGSDRHIATVSFTVEGMDNTAVAAYLEGAGILSRAGLHCASRAHRTLGTYPEGTVRFSLSFTNTEEEIDRAVESLASLLDRPSGRR